MRKGCDTCKFGDISYYETPCRKCSDNALFWRENDVDNWQPAKPRRKELQAKLDAALQRIDSLIEENITAADDFDASESGKSALRAEIDRLKAVVSVLRSENLALYTYRTSSIDKLAAKQAIIDEQRKEIAYLLDFRLEEETTTPDGCLGVLSRRELQDENKRLASELAELRAEMASNTLWSIIYDDTEGERDLALATCTELADKAALADGWRALYAWGAK